VGANTVGVCCCCCCYLHNASISVAHWDQYNIQYNTHFSRNGHGL